MPSSGDSRTKTPGPPRLGPSFQLLMQVRALVTIVTLFLLPHDQVNAITALVIVGLTFLYWLAARYWERIVPQIIAHPLLTGTDLFVSLVVLSFEGPSGPFFQSTVVAAAIAGLLFHWRGMLLVALTQIACYFAALGYYSTLIESQKGSIGNFQTLFSQPAYYLVIGLVGVMLRRLFDEQAAAEEGKREAEIRSVAADERARLAREMHDSLAKTLRGIAMSAQALPIWVHKSPERAISEGQRIASAAEIASREARELISDLRDDQVQMPLVDSIGNLLDRWSAEAQLVIDRDLDESADLPLVARYELRAILKEALTNVERHAAASTVRIGLEARPQRVTLTIEDDGEGFDCPPEGPDWLDELARNGHYGVIGMYERAKRANADLAVRSAPGSGTTLVITFTDQDTSSSDSNSGSDEKQPAEAG